MSLEHKSHMWR